MPIVVRLKQEIARCGIKQNDLAQEIGISPVNLSRIARNHVKAIRFSTLDALCQKLNCDVGDILTYEPAPSKSAGAETDESESLEHINAVLDHDDDSFTLME